MYRYKIKHNGVNFLATVYKLDVDGSISTFNLKARNMMHC